MTDWYGWHLNDEMIEVMAKDPRSFSQMMNEQPDNEGEDNADGTPREPDQAG